MKKYILLYLSALLILTTFSCTEEFEEMNTPSAAITEPNVNFLFFRAQEMVWFDYQRNYNLYADLYSQYFANAVSGFPSGRYEYVDHWVGNFFREHMSDFLRRSLLITEICADDPSMVELNAINEIYACFIWSRFTDYYGDAPYFEAAKGEPAKYDSQQDIYMDLLSRLETAVNNINGAEGQVRFDPNYERLYGGDPMKWKRFGNSMRLRLAMRISNIDPSTAQSVAADAVASGVMTSNDDVAKLGSWIKGWYDYLQKTCWDWDNCRVSKTFTDYLYSESTAGEDPRAPFWLTYKVEGEATSKEDLGVARYEGLENGYTSTMPEDAIDRATIHLDGPYADFAEREDVEIEIPIMFYSEVLFLQSEAALRGWISGDANALFKEGIQASMDYIGVDAAASQAYIDGVTDLAGSNEAQLKSIITQKWIANFPNGVEAWSDFRRTDYPDLTLPIEGVSGDATVAQGTYVKRIRYPNNQHELNQGNMPAGQNSLDTDRMDLKVWWDVADTKTKGSNGLMNSNF